MIRDLCQILLCLGLLLYTALNCYLESISDFQIILILNLEKISESAKLSIIHVNRTYRKQVVYLDAILQE